MDAAPASAFRRGIAWVKYGETCATQPSAIYRALEARPQVFYKI
jgi:hypothetical protein